MNEPYPVALEIARPPTFQRAHVFLRIAVLVVIGWIAHPIGLLWLGVPLVAAILVSQKGGRRYLDEEGPTVTRIIGWILELAAYLTQPYPAPSIVSGRAGEGPDPYLRTFS